MWKSKYDFNLIFFKVRNEVAKNKQYIHQTKISRKLYHECKLQYFRLNMHNRGTVIQNREVMIGGMAIYQGNLALMIM